MRARMEAAFSMVARALSLANSAHDDIGRVHRRVSVLKETARLHQ